MGSKGSLKECIQAGDSCPLTQSGKEASGLKRKVTVHLVQLEKEFMDALSMKQRMEPLIAIHHSLFLRDK